jgi:hypothetical protein
VSVEDSDYDILRNILKVVIPVLEKKWVYRHDIIKHN